MNRLLSIGFPLPNVQVDNYTVFSAPSYFDYQVMAIDPESITAHVRDLIEGKREFAGFDGRPVVNGAGTAEFISAADQLNRRAAEARRFLEAGGAMIVVARPNAVRHGLLGFEGCDRYSWLPAPDGMSWGPPFIRAAEGKTVRIDDEDHPAAGFLRGRRTDIAYRAVFDDRNSALRQAGRVIATGGAGLPIAVEFGVLGGKVLFLPAMGDPSSAQRTQMGEQVVELANALLKEAASSSTPYWAAQVPVPGIAAVEERLKAAEREAAEAVERSDALRAEFDELARHRRMLWESGATFQALVVDALRMIGFEVSGGQKDEPYIVSGEGERAMLETESDPHEVVEWPYVRLQRRLEERLLKRNERYRGLIVVNGHRATAPENRKQEHTDALRIACENYRYTLITAQSLFALVTRILDGASDADLLGARRRLMSVNGLLDRESALGDSPLPEVPDPLF